MNLPTKKYVWMPLKIAPEPILDSSAQKELADMLYDDWYIIRHGTPTTKIEAMDDIYKIIKFLRN